MDEMSYSLPIYAGGYLEYNSKGEVVSLVFIVKNYQETEKMFQANFLGFCLKILNKNEDNASETIYSLSSQGKFSDVEVGMLIELSLSNDTGTVSIPLVVERDSVDFYKKWMENRAILKRYPAVDSNFSFSLS